MPVVPARRRSRGQSVAKRRAFTCPPYPPAPPLMVSRHFGLALRRAGIPARNVCPPSAKQPRRKIRIYILPPRLGRLGFGASTPMQLDGVASCMVATQLWLAAMCYSVAFRCAETGCARKTRACCDIFSTSAHLAMIPGRVGGKIIITHSMARIPNVGEPS